MGKVDKVDAEEMGKDTWPSRKSWVRRIFIGPAVGQYGGRGLQYRIADEFASAHAGELGDPLFTWINLIVDNRGGTTKMNAASNFPAKVYSMNPVSMFERLRVLYFSE
ncbi:hypothetical protein GJ744_005517 [Endocarpon pusillum]|uniref:Uncharacterized protein n=1 Tax=Endocarpon pusillum TaxID=364733 RepID=A0A8H7E8Q6_9EURO|nr:hypothetical protein GJ744_005517 [Endocarpon pusillum]